MGTVGTEHGYGTWVRSVRYMGTVGTVHGYGTWVRWYGTWVRYMGTVVQYIGAVLQHMGTVGTVSSTWVHYRVQDTYSIGEDS